MRTIPAKLFAIVLLLTAFASIVKADPVTVEPLIDSKPLIQGSTARLAVKITIDPAYHIQSATPHDKFLIATSIKLEPTPGITAAAPGFPIAKELMSLGTLDASTISAYDGTIYILVPLTIAADASVGEKIMNLAVTAQACNDASCLPPSTYKLTLPVTIAPSGTASTRNAQKDFAAADAQTFAPITATTFTAPVQPSTTAPALQSATTEPSAGTRVKLLSVAEQISLIHERPYKPFNAADNYPLWTIVLFALLGGLILNIMPCVLPVIPLKVLSLVQHAHGDRKVAVLHALTFSAGVISLFIALALFLKIGGLFYGQQFQSPAFLISMIMFVIALSLSMMGVWTINPPRAVYNVDTAGSGHLASFTSGLMATLLATPCSAPYLGPVLAWALIQPAWVTALALGLVGVGMSVPYLLLAAFPAGLNKLPRAGRWSELLKQGLGIVMIGVAVYLITLVPNVTMWPWILLGTVVLGLACWGWGQIPSPSMDPAKVWIIRSIVIVIAVIFGFGLYALAERSALAAPLAEVAGDTAILPDKTTTNWMPFNLALLDEALKQNRPVVVDWGADWCINCRYLEGTVLSSQPVRDAFAARNVVLLRADLSEDNPPASEFNQKLGGQAIPVLAIFSPTRPYHPVVLRDKYSKARVIEEIKSAQ